MGFPLICLGFVGVFFIPSREPTLFDPTGFETRFAGEVKGFDPATCMDRKEARRTDRFVQFAVSASQEALRTSELQITPENSADIGVIIGSAIGGLDTLTQQAEVLRTRGPGRISPFLVPAMISNMASGQVSIMTGARGPNMCVASACASGAHAIGACGADGWDRCLDFAAGNGGLQQRAGALDPQR